MYGLAGERRLTEWQADWLPGYEGSGPVRIGNAASRQSQLDVFGEVMDALHQARLGVDEAGWDLQRTLIAHLETIWDQPDRSIWETRGKARQFTYSKVMAWVAVDRAIKTAREFGMTGPVARWEALAKHIHQDICDKGFNSSLGSFVKVYGTKSLDASLLLLPIIGFLPASDPRIQGTVAAIERHLMTDGLVRRHNNSRSGDGSTGEEGVFLACSFWLADNYILVDRCDEARELFERLLALRNDVGLLSEEYNPGSRRQTGNFPQAFSHVALINTAYNLSAVKRSTRSRSAPALPGMR
jgi:GH15 family glucan-1,4-alpha-glucosidase